MITLKTQEFVKKGIKGIMYNIFEDPFIFYNENENTKLFERFYKQLKDDEKIKIYNIKLSDLLGEENAVMEFKVEGLPDWLFGAWISRDDFCNPIIEVFCQYERFVDKFKPSQGKFNVACKIYEYPSKDGRKAESIDLYKVVEYIKFMKTHEAVFYYCGDDITLYKSERECKKIMKREVRKDIKYQKAKKDTYFLIKDITSKLEKLDLIEYYYAPDMWNDEPDHINDIWFIYIKNPIVKHIINFIKKRKDKFLGLGSMWIYKTEEKDIYEGDVFAEKEERAHQYEVLKSLEEEVAHE